MTGTSDPRRIARTAACLPAASLLFASLAHPVLAETQPNPEQAPSMELLQCRTELNACLERHSKTFLVVMMRWPTSDHDVDLHVIDATGTEFYYQAKTNPGRPGALSVDTVRGPGVEIWEVGVAPPGEYRVLYNLYDRAGNPQPAMVGGGVYHRDGHDALPQRRLTEEGRANAVLAAVVTVDPDGGVEVSAQ